MLQIYWFWCGQERLQMNLVREQGTFEGTIVAMEGSEWAIFVRNCFSYTCWCNTSHASNSWCWNQGWHWDGNGTQAVCHGVKHDFCEIHDGPSVNRSHRNDTFPALQWAEHVRLLMQRFASKQDPPTGSQLPCLCSHCVKPCFAYWCCHFACFPGC